MDVDEPTFDTPDSEEQELAAILEAIDDVRNGRLVPLRKYDRDFRERNKIVLDDDSLSQRDGSQ